MQICDKKYCTACGACAYTCPKKCIEMEYDEVGNIYPIVDCKLCVNCGKCVEICPQNTKIQGLTPIKSYAAWSTDTETRRTSASGGIAAEIYREACKNGCVVGAKLTESFSVKLKLVDNFEECIGFKNSKYVFSEPYDVYNEIAEAIKHNKNVTAIGLPCQIAAIRSIFPKTENLVLVDLVCHGVMANDYLQQHIKHLNKKINADVATVSFRDPDLGTEKYYFSMYDELGGRLYAKRIKDGDTYNYAYHNAVAYRENCYHCIYACKERVSDITLGDYHGLGKLAPCDYTPHKVSTVVVHSTKGDEIIQNLFKINKIFLEQRPTEEPILGDAQFRYPSIKSYKSVLFQKMIKKYNADFEKAIKFVMNKMTFREFAGKIVRIPRRMLAVFKKIRKIKTNKK